ncbi:MAG: hypothetical protein CW338_01685 [Clostridiales bacterium]|nr:hypothetical protein [Clostridiales bacterium]
MKKKFVSVFLMICAALFAAGFAAHLYFDYTLHYEYGSAPFRLYVIERFAEFTVPAIGCFAAGMLLRRKAG